MGGCFSTDEDVEASGRSSAAVQGSSQPRASDDRGAFYRASAQPEDSRLPIASAGRASLEVQQPPSSAGGRGTKNSSGTAASTSSPLTSNTLNLDLDAYEKELNDLHGKMMRRALRKKSASSAPGFLTPAPRATSFMSGVAGPIDARASSTAARTSSVTSMLARTTSEGHAVGTAGTSGGGHGTSRISGGGGGGAPASVRAPSLLHTHSETDFEPAQGVANGSSKRGGGGGASGPTPTLSPSAFRRMGSSSELSSSLPHRLSQIGKRNYDMAAIAQQLQASAPTSSSPPPSKEITSKSQQLQTFPTLSSPPPSNGPASLEKQLQASAPTSSSPPTSCAPRGAAGASCAASGLAVRDNDEGSGGADRTTPMLTHPTGSGQPQPQQCTPTLTQPTGSRQQQPQPDEPQRTQRRRSQVQGSEITAAGPRGESYEAGYIMAAGPRGECYEGGGESGSGSGGGGGRFFVNGGLPSFEAGASERGFGSTGGTAEPMSFEGGGAGGCGAGGGVAGVQSFSTSFTGGVPGISGGGEPCMSDSFTGEGGGGGAGGWQSRFSSASRVTPCSPSRSGHLASGGPYSAGNTRSGHLFLTGGLNSGSKLAAGGPNSGGTAAAAAAGPLQLQIASNEAAGGSSPCCRREGSAQMSQQELLFGIIEHPDET